jgi:hypothetical protein
MRYKTEYIRFLCEDASLPTYDVVSSGKYLPCFKGVSCLHLQWKWTSYIPNTEAANSSKMLATVYNENSIISQKTRVFINNSVRTSNLTHSYGMLRNSKKGTYLKPLH